MFPITSVINTDASMCKQQFTVVAAWWAASFNYTTLLYYTFLNYICSYEGKKLSSYTQICIYLFLAFFNCFSVNYICIVLLICTSKSYFKYIIHLRSLQG